MISILFIQYTLARYYISSTQPYTNQLAEIGEFSI
nr:MAG TPA: hypothetical protein [Caudoviricetes sp.]